MLLPPVEPTLKSELAIWAQRVLSALPPRPMMLPPRGQQDFAVLEFVFKQHFITSQYTPRSQQQYAVLQFVITAEAKSQPKLPSLAMPLSLQQNQKLAEGAIEDLAAKVETVPRSQQQFAVLQFTIRTHQKIQPSLPCLATPGLIQENQKRAQGEATDLVAKIENIPRSQQHFAVLQLTIQTEYKPPAPLPCLTSPRLTQQNQKIPKGETDALVAKIEQVPQRQQHFSVLQSSEKTEYKVLNNLPRLTSPGLIQENQRVFNAGKKCENHKVEVAQEDDIDDEWSLAEDMQDVECQPDQEDDWEKVDELYTPSMSEGMCVIVENCSTALTADGRAVNSSNGGAVVFACESEQSSGHADKIATIKTAKATRDARVVEAANNVATETVCSIDNAGTVRGASSVLSLSPTDAQARNARLKLFHNIKVGRRSAMATEQLPLLSVDPAGRLLFIVDVSEFGKPVAEEVFEKVESPTSVISVEHWNVDRGSHTHSNVVLLLDENGVIQLD